MQARAPQSRHHDSHVQLGLLKGLHSLFGAKLLLPGKQVEQHGGASFDLGHAELGWRQRPHKLCIRIRAPGGELDAGRFQGGPDAGERLALLRPAAAQ